MNTDNLKKAREAAGYTQAQAAAKLGISDGTYKNYEQGKREPNGEKLVALARLYNVTTDYLLGYSKEEFSLKPEKPIKDTTLKALEETIVEKYSKLPEAARESMMRFLQDIIDDAHELREPKLIEKVVRTTCGELEKNLEPIEDAG